MRFVLMIFSVAYLSASIAARLRQRDTQLRHLLAYSQGLIDHLGEKICVIGPDYRIRFANDLVRRNLADGNGQTCYAALWGEEKPCRACPLALVRRRVPSSIKVHTFFDLMEQGLRRIDLIVRRFLMMARQDGGF